MASAKVLLPDGTIVTIEGTEKEIGRLLNSYGAPKKRAVATPTTKPFSGQKSDQEKSVGIAEKSTPDLSQIVSMIKECEEAESIESEILDKNNLAGRVLLPLYIIQVYLEDEFALTSGEISKITTELGVPISQSNVSTTLSGKVKRFVIGDKMRKKGMPVRYRISRPGAKYVKELLNPQHMSSTKP